MKRFAIIKNEMGITVMVREMDLYLSVINGLVKAIEDDGIVLYASDTIEFREEE